MPGIIVGPLRRAAGRGAVFVLGLLAVVAGAGFLSAAALMLLAEWRGLLFALQVMGGGYLVLGGALTLLATRRPVPPPDPAPKAQPALVLAEAFLSGLEAGRSAARPATAAGR